MNKNLYKNKRGFSIPFAIIFLFVAFLLGVAIHFMTRTQMRMSFHAHYNEIAFQTGESALDSALFHYRKYFNKVDDKLYKLLCQGQIDSIDLPDFTPDMFPPLEQLTKDFPGLTVKVEGKLVELVEIPSNVFDSWEKKGKMSLTAYVTYRDVDKTMAISRGFRFVNVIPPLVSRFSLFVKDAANQIHNTLYSSRNGSVSGGKPFVLHNGTAADLLQNGWVFMGGGRVNLNIGRGESNFGEDFHLPPEITRSVFFPNQNYALLHANTGFYREAATEAIFSNYPKKDVFKSSCLRLFGCKAVGDGDASPTLVIGDVWRRYLQGSAVGSVSGSSIGKVAFMPWVLKRQQIPKETGIAPFLFLSSKLYRVYMSQVREEPFNRSFDFILTAGEVPTPLLLKKSMKDRFDQVYPLVEPTVKIVNYRGEEYFNDTIKNYSYREGVIEKCAFEYESFDEFIQVMKEEALGDKVFTLNGIHLIKQGKSDMKKHGPLKFRGHGMIVFQGRTQVGNLELDDPDKDMISVAVLKDYMQVAGKKIHAGLICDLGNIRIQSGLTLKGMMAGTQFTPEEMQKGGILEYDSRYNPELPTYKEYYSFTTEGRYAFFREE